jgi:hypothetical protein
METTLEYMARMHQQLADNYMNEERTERAACGIIAVEVGKRLKREGKYPGIKSMASFDLPSSVRGSLMPLIFKGKWDEGWGSHHVCWESGLMYDPLLGEPVPELEYSQKMFGFYVPLRSEFSFANFARLVGRRKTF